MFNLRSWATPLTIGSFIISALSGIILFFHWDIGMMKPAHEYLSWFLVLGVIMHIIINWRPMLVYFKKPIPLAIIGIFIILTALSFATLGESSGDHGGKNRKVAMQSLKLLQSAPISMIAKLSEVTPESLSKKLKEKGFVVISESQTLASIAKNNDTSAQEVLSILIK